MVIENDAPISTCFLCLSERTLLSGGLSTREEWDAVT